MKHAFASVAALALLTVQLLGEEPVPNSVPFVDHAEELRGAALRNLEPTVIVGTSHGSRHSTGIYPWKRNIVTIVFSLGMKGPGGRSAWDAQWREHYGGYDDPSPARRRNFAPAAFTPKTNPFYIALPYNDLSSNGVKNEAKLVIPWFKQAFENEEKSVCRDRWLEIRTGSGKACYAQWTDCGPHRSDHWQYVFGNELPRPNPSQGAGLSVSPAVRDYLGLASMDVTDWRFVEAEAIPRGPWLKDGPGALEDKAPTIDISPLPHKPQD